MLVAVVERVVQVVAAIDQKPKYLMEDVRPPVKFVEVKTSHPRRIDDDWFVQQDVAAKERGIILSLLLCVRFIFL